MKMKKWKEGNSNGTMETIVIKMTIALKDG